ncbi:MAG: 2-oxoacid:acceptor oxidoreductase family protein [Zestosphaera sp.]
MVEWNIRILGIGGQGVVLSSVILAHAAVIDGFNAVQTQRYGAEVRGGEVYADVKISSEEIYSPSLDEVDYMVGFVYSTLAKYVNTLKENGLLIVDGDLVRDLPPTLRKPGAVYRVPAARIATELGETRSANIVMLGALQAVTSVVSEASLLKSIELHIPRRYLELNKKAYYAGRDFALSLKEG